ncbi:MAG: signal recognition particle-docking protein FtsY [Treponema sp.]|jgi:fused signal recognition particle receptor|nr:signal recognition particle-docking protein FtsY [Treponema sp.]
MALNFAERIKDFFGFSKTLSDDFFDNLADLLVEGDFGAAGAMRLVDELRDLSKKERIGDSVLLAEKFARLLEQELDKPFSRLPRPQPQPPERPDLTGLSSALSVILLLGVNGVGKTTTAAKLARLYRSRGRKPILAAADTFRAAAIDQIKIHGDRLKIRVVAHQHGGDPAAVVYDAVEAALAGGGDLVVTDTAGRMHTKAALVEELKKIDRVLETKLGTGENRKKWLVLDATTGRNAVAQAEIFHDAVKLDGVILTKYDSSAKGGAVFSLASELFLPVVFICDGESYDAIRPFDPRRFSREFAGLPD